MVSKEERGSACSSREVTRGQWSLQSLEAGSTHCHYRLASEIVLRCWQARTFWHVGATLACGLLFCSYPILAYSPYQTTEHSKPLTIFTE